MTMKRDQVGSLFENLGNGHSDLFFSRVADNVEWTVKGSHPLAGTYHRKDDFVKHTFARLDKIMRAGVVLKVKHVFIDGDWAIVEMESTSVAKNGKPFHNEYCWLCRFDEEMIVEVRAYLDSALVQKTIDENEVS
jgi:ketosteroid isomerase-like protein